MSGTKASGNRTGRTRAAAAAQVAGRSPEAMALDKITKIAMGGGAALTAVPAMPGSSWRDERAEELWTRLAQLMIAEKMLFDLDLPLLELTILKWRMAELMIEAGTPGPAVAAAKAAAASLEKLGMAKLARLAARPASPPGIFDDFLAITKA